MKWQGVFPAVTTPLREDLSIDFEFLPRQLESMLAAGCRGFVLLGSLGEAATMSFEEKGAVLEAGKRALAGRAPLVAGIAALSTAEAVATARLAEAKGCDGLMVLPAYVYRTDARETAAHFSAGHRRDAAAVHALQQSARLRHGRAARGARWPSRRSTRTSSP